VEKDDIWAIEHRHSVRRYTEEPLSAAEAEALERVIAQANEASGLAMRLVTDEPTAFDSLLAHYGRFQNVSDYVVVAGPKGRDLQELAGYFGEKVVLAATRLGLGSCWVGGTFRRRSVAGRVAPGHKLACVIALGHGAEPGRPHRSKSIEELSNTHGLVMPNWFQHGMQAAALAPTALNQQHFIFTLGRDRQTVTAQSSGGPMSMVDLGIAELHFELASGHAVSGSAPARMAAGAQA
jgi:nitroreductase